MKHILIDFDGVVNVPPQRGTEGSWISVIVHYVHIYARKDVIEFINSVPQGALTWLTTWEDDTVLFSEIGLGYLPYIPFPTAPDRDWKVDAVHQWLAEHPDHEVVWIDDENELLSQVTHPRLLVLNPDPEVGLTSKNIKDLEDWLTT